MTRRDLILYATPEGSLGDQCRRFFARSGAEFGLTTAHRYPPHVTLTGFFRRPSSSLERIVDEFDRAVASTRWGPVSVGSLSVRSDWVGLEVESKSFKDLARTFSALHRVDAGDDAIRLKDWLHLSLAYGETAGEIDLDRYADVARAQVDAAADVTWHVGLWTRHVDQWTCLSSTKIDGAEMS